MLIAKELEKLLGILIYQRIPLKKLFAVIQPNSSWQNIQTLLDIGKSIADISVYLKRYRSTIYREMNRAVIQTDYYSKSGIQNKWLIDEPSFKTRAGIYLKFVLQRSYFVSYDIF